LLPTGPTERPIVPLLVAAESQAGIIVREEQHIGSGRLGSRLCPGFGQTGTPVRAIQMPLVRPAVADEDQALGGELGSTQTDGTSPRRAPCGATGPGRINGRVVMHGGIGEGDLGGAGGSEGQVRLP
jgi:hypothetical protein